MRRQFHLPEQDREYLESCGREWEAIVDGGGQWVLLPAFPLPAGYNHTTATAAIMIPPGYPDVQLDMVFFAPSLARADGQPINATQCYMIIDGKSFQRWSRHRTAQNPWQPGVDCLATHILLIDHWLKREFVGRQL